MYCSARQWIQASKLAVAVLWVSSWHCPSQCATPKQPDAKPVALQAKTGALAGEPKDAKKGSTAAEKKPDAVSTYKVLNSAIVTAKKPASATKPTTTRRAPRRELLVPPPPPSIPTFLSAPSVNPTFNQFGYSVQLMSLPDLKFEQKNLEKKLDAAKLDEQDQKRTTDEKQERAKRFVELFGEGVVSKRELETAQQESERSVRDLEQAHIKVSEIDRVYIQVKDRIKALEPASKKPTQLSTKKSRTR